MIDLFSKIMSRSKMYSRIPGLQETPSFLICAITKDETNLVWAAAKKLEVKVIQGVDIEQAEPPDPSIDECIVMLKAQVSRFRQQTTDEKLATFTARDLRAVHFVIRHLDQILIKEEGEAAGRKRPKGTRKK